VKGGLRIKGEGLRVKRQGLSAKGQNPKGLRVKRVRGRCTRRGRWKERREPCWGWLSSHLQARSADTPVAWLAV